MFGLPAALKKRALVVDGDEAKSCNTPCAIHLPAGRHTLTAALGGYYLAQRIIHVPDDSSLYVPLAQITGWVQLCIDTVRCADLH